MARSFEDVLKDDFSPQERAQIEVRARAELEKMHLASVREAAGKTQFDVARRLQVSQAAVSKMERQADMLLSTFRNYIEALGGTLKLSVELPGATLSGESLSELFANPPLSVFPMERGGSASSQHAARREIDDTFEVTTPRARFVSMRAANHHIFTESNNEARVSAAA